MKRNEKPKREFSKTLLIQESVLIWITTLLFVGLAFYCVYLGYVGSLPWLTAMVSLPWTAYGVSQVYYYKKSMAENTKDGVKFESVMAEVNHFYSNAIVEPIIEENSAVEEDLSGIIETDDTTNIEYGI